ncbi:hypothetical protein D4R51_04005 [bacterium]|nr:MAG: hypothetical protein D4R51_04005 [bacterium]
MREFFRKIGDFVKNIQRSDDRAKKRWLILFSGVLMFLVIVLWVAYLNVTLPRSSTIPTVTSTVVFAPSEDSGTGSSFFKTLGLGWEMVWGSIRKNVKTIGDSVADGWAKFKEQLNRTNELNLDKPAQNPNSTSTVPLP